MLQNYLRVAARNLWTRKGFTATTLLGLGLSMAVCLLLLLFLRQQFNYDRWHAESDRIMRVTSTETEHGRRYATSPGPLGPALAAQHASVEAAVRMDRGTAYVHRGPTTFLADGLYAEDGFFDIFDFRLQAGDPATALARPRSAVLTPDLAAKLFDLSAPSDAVGRTFMAGDSTAMTVTGVLARPAGPSHFKFEVLYSFATLEARPSRQEALQAWGDITGQYNYLLLADGAAPQAVERQANQLLASHLPADEADHTRFQLQALTDINLGEHLWNEIRYAFLPRPVAVILGLLALLILVAAGFNYVNLTVARSLRRAREIGVRKAVGAHRWQLFGQFLCESVLISLLAAGIAVVALVALLPAFNNLYVIGQLLEIPLRLDPLRDPALFALVPGFAVAVGLLAGLYPAVVLSRPHPSHILQSSGPQTAGSSGRWTTKGLIAFQFALTLVFAATTVFLYQQATYTLTADHGFDEDRLVRIRTYDVPNATLAREAERLPSVEHATLMSNVPLSGSYNLSPLRRPDQDKVVDAYDYAVDSTFVADLKLTWAARTPDTDTRFASGQGVLLNAKAVQALGLDRPEATLGATVLVGSDRTPRTVVGVVTGYHFKPFLHEIQPLVLEYNPDRFNHLLVRARSGEVSASITGLEGIWAGLGVADPLDPERFETIMRSKYGPLQDLSHIVALVAGLAVLIACLGLLGIAAYAVDQRTREVGIRKALGARARDLVVLLSRQFAGLVGIGIVVALPAAWFVNRLWLQAFAYRVDAGLATFAACALVLFALALGVVGSQAWRAARTDPARVLRSE
jgi:putative ABC transport system permease protein